MSRSTRWTIAVLIVVAAIVVALLVELRQPASKTAPPNPDYDLARSAPPNPDNELTA